MSSFLWDERGREPALEIEIRDFPLLNGFFCAVTTDAAVLKKCVSVCLRVFIFNCRLENMLKDFQTHPKVNILTYILGTLSLENELSNVTPRFFWNHHAGLVNTWPGLLSLNPVGHYNLCRGVVVLESVSDLICLTGGFYETLREPGGSWVLNKSLEYNKTALFPNVSLLLNRTEIKPALPSQRAWIINQRNVKQKAALQKHAVPANYAHFK